MPDYAYINTRIRSMERDLLNEGQLRELLSFRDLPAAVTCLRKTIYGLYFPEGIDESLINKTDIALRTSLSESMYKIITLFNKSDSALIDALLGRWDVFNIKTLIRGKLNNMPAHEVLSATVPAGSLDALLIEEIYRQPSVQAILDMLLTIGCPYVAPIIRIRYLQEGDLFRGEVELERAFFSNALRQLNAYGKSEINNVLVEDMIRMLIDRYNLIAAIKASEEDIGIEDALTYFIEGGKVISFETFKNITRCRDINECLSMLDSATWKTHWDRFSSQSRITSRVLLVERWMDYEMLAHAVRIPREDPLNIGLVISYIWRKTNEVINLRTILRGIHFTIPQDEIEGLLLIV